MKRTELDIAGLASHATSDLLELWGVLRRHRNRIFLLTAMVGLLTALVVFQMTPVYRGTALMLIENSVDNKVMTLNDLYSNQRQTVEAFNSQLQILHSRAVAERVIRNLKLYDHPSMDPRTVKSRFGLFEAKAETRQMSEDQMTEALVGRVAGGLSIEPLWRSQIVKVSFDSPDRELAAKVANALVDAYIDNDFESRSGMTQRASAWLNERMAGIRTKLEESERALQHYREQENIVDNKGVVLSGTGRQFEEVSTNLIAARMRLAEAQNAYNQVKDAKGQPLSVLESLPAVLKDSTVRQMKSVESEAMRKVDEYKSRYASAHPKMIAATAELQSAHNALAQAIQTVIAGIYREYEIARDNASAAAGAKARTQAEIQSITRKGAQLSMLERDVESYRLLYSNFINRAKEAEAAINLQSTPGRMIDPAVVPLSPVKPNKFNAIAGALFLGLLGSSLLVLLRAYLDNTLRSEQEIERRLHVSVLGTVPLLDKKDGGENPSLVFLQNPNSPFAEAVRGIRTSVLLSAVDEPHRVVAITSTIPGEGKTTIAISLAQALGQVKKVLLIDADMRRPTVGKNIGDGLHEEVGLVDYLAGDAELADCIHGTPNPNVSVLPAGKRLSLPLELLSSQKFGDTIAGLKELYDMVIIDCPPLKPVSDSLVISRYANSVLYVIKADEAPYQMIASSLKSLREVDAPLLGVVLNQVNTRLADHYGNYSYQYQYVYGQEPEKRPRTFLGIRI
jgi:capsular exopolysaccharide synthesis family protein